MPVRDTIPVEQWRLACEVHHHPIAFVDINNRFVFCNQAYCMLVGWAESELRDRSWKDITKQHDVGADLDEVEAVLSGVKKQYYMEKTYVRKNGEEVHASIFVHRFPDVGPQQGFICFADRKGSPELSQMEKKYSELQTSLVLVQTQQSSFNLLSSQVSEIARQLQHNTDETKNTRELAERTILTVAGKPASGNVHVGDHSGRDKIHNQQIIFIVLGTVLCICLIAIVVILLGGNMRVEHGNSNIDVSSQKSKR